MLSRQLQGADQSSWGVKFGERGLRWALTVSARKRGVEGLVSAIDHADRARPLRDYCVGLLLGVMADRARLAAGGAAKIKKPEAVFQEIKDFLD
jgi:hypothetical protein